MKIFKSISQNYSNKQPQDHLTNFQAFSLVVSKSRQTFGDEPVCRDSDYHRLKAWILFYLTILTSSPFRSSLRIFFSTSLRAIITWCSHPQHFSLKSAPLRSTSQSKLPQGCFFFNFTISPTSYWYAIYPAHSFSRLYFLSSSFMHFVSTRSFFKSNARETWCVILVSASWHLLFRITALYTPFRSAQNHCLPDNVRPRGAFISVGDWTPTEKYLLLLTTCRSGSLNSDWDKSMLKSGVVINLFFRYP